MTFSKDFAADATANPYTPDGFISQLSNAQNTNGIGLRPASASDIRLVHDADYGDVIESTLTVTNTDTWSGGEEFRVGFYVRSGANAGAGIAARILPESDYISIRTYTAAGADSGVATGALGTISNGDSYTLSYNRTTGAVSVRKNAGSAIISGTNSTYAAEASLAAGFFMFQDGGSNTAYASSFASGGGGSSVPNKQHHYRRH